MIELALHEGEGLVQLREVADAQALSVKYLEQLTISLRHAGLVRAERGPQGGYELSRPAEEITVLEIVQAVEGPLGLVGCITQTGTCDRREACAAHGLWCRLNSAIGRVLSDSTLADLRREQRALAEPLPSYQI
jgi:Rrf2 family protein